MIRNCTCRECDHSFEGGPRAYYCPSCRVDRQRIQSAESKARARRGLTRKLGSIDKCERCRNPYTVEAPLQRFCPDCQLIHKLEHDYDRSIPKYESNRDRLNPARNERRRVGERNCDWCGTIYTQTNKSLTCGLEECKKRLKNKKWNEVYGPRYQMKKTIFNPK